MSRRAYALATLVAVGIIVYGSLVPFRYTPIPWGEGVARFRALPYLQIGPGSRADWVANILLFVPLGFLSMGALALNRKTTTRLIAAAVVILAGTALSVAIEFTQVWFPPRTVSQNDVFAETIGGIAGVLIWFAIGPALTAWIDRTAAARRSRDRFVRVLEVYAAGLAVYSVLPLDLTLSSGELAHKVREGRIVLAPFSDVSSSLDSLYGIVRDVSVFLPIGMLLAVWRTRAPARTRPIAVVALMGACAAGLLELAQVFVLSRFASTTDVFLGTAGAALGGVLMVWLLTGRYGADAVDRPTAAGRRAAAWGGATIVWALVVFAVFCAPFEVSGTAAEWRARYEGFWALPFARLYTGSEFNAVSNVARKLLLFGLFGGLAARTLLILPLPRPLISALLVGVVLGGAGLSLAIELTQVLLPPHVPDVTDVLLGGAGAALGVAVVRAVVRKSV